MGFKMSGLTGLVLGAFLAFAPAQTSAQVSGNYETQKAYSGFQRTAGNPFIQIYNRKIEITENKKKIFRNYLEQGFLLSREISKSFSESYQSGLIDFDRFRSGFGREVFYNKGIESINSGDPDIYDNLFKSIASRHEILIGANNDVLKRNLDSKYNFARTSIELVRKRGRIDDVDFSMASVDILDLRLLYEILGFSLPEK